jgi:hypothetical protein
LALLRDHCVGRDLVRERHLVFLLAGVDDDQTTFKARKVAFRLTTPTST